ncbi:MAG: hypothetical protein Unbinned5607contig1000_51 [Prokaryotic dsDNA virus sp.]|nr:MAG: hypothetical protein Unbinned5607contig1000_51 [Prokaryotic dsDNA virus sp.]|tara:strand:+ start:22991 stop:23167 length:177 start_codon:yes stop_codon:yes gene_type:complete
MEKLEFTKLELEVIDYALELAWPDRKPRHKRAITRAQLKVRKLQMKPYISDSGRLYYV